MIINLVAPDKMSYDVEVQVVPRKDEYLRYVIEGRLVIEGVVLDVAHSISKSNHLISVIMKSL